MNEELGMRNEEWEIGGKTLSSRLLIGSALYPSPANMEDAIKISGSQIVTVSLRRQAAGGTDGSGGNQFWDIIKSMGIEVLPTRQALTLQKKPSQPHRWRERSLVLTG